MATRSTRSTRPSVDDITDDSEDADAGYVGTPDVPVVPVAVPAGVRVTPNAWWCPDDDRAMPLADACDVCGKAPTDFA